MCWGFVFSNTSSSLVLLWRQTEANGRRNTLVVASIGDQIYLPLAAILSGLLNIVFCQTCIGFMLKLFGRLSRLGTIGLVITRTVPLGLPPNPRDAPSANCGCGSTRRRRGCFSPARPRRIRCAEPLNKCSTFSPGASQHGARLAARAG